MRYVLAVTRTGASAPAGRKDRARAWRLAAFASFCILLTVLHTWPLAAAPHRYSRVDNGDFLLNAWAVAWVSHQVTTDPAHLFDANIFWPERRTLAYSEAMIVQGVLALPITALGGSPVLAYNLVMLAGFASTAFFFGLVARRWTGSWAAAAVTASAAGFSAHLLMRLGQLQAMHVEFVAVVLFAIDLVFSRQRIRDALLLAAGFVLQSLTSVYLMVFTVWAMFYAAATRMASAAAAARKRAIVLLAIAAVVSVALLAFYLNAYRQLHAEQGFARSAVETRALAATWADYLSTGSRLHYRWSRPFTEVCNSMNFPGFTVLALVIAGLASARVRRSPQAQMCLGVAAGCALTSFGPRVPGYEVVHHWIPLFWAVRAQAHLGQIVLLALALLAGYGVLVLRRRWGTRRGWFVVAAALVVLVNAESLRAPIGWRVFDGIPAVYDVLARQPAGAVVELPMYERRALYGNASYMLNSTRHWKPLLNGYSGFIPASYQEAWSRMRAFPGFDSLELLHERDVRYVVIHRDRFVGMYGPAAFDAIAGTASLSELASDGDIHLFRFR